MHRESFLTIENLTINSLSNIDLQVAIAQMNAHVGNISANSADITRTIESHGKTNDLIIFPELCVCGYPPEDLLLRSDFIAEVDQAVAAIAKACNETTAIIGYPRSVNTVLYNCAGVLQNGQLVAEYFKQKLPNYQVFDERRYFECGTESVVVNVKNYRVGLLICEDIWFPEPIAALAEQTVDLVVSINASPYSQNFQQHRIDNIKDRSIASSLPIIYVNQTGAQDELVFDGASMIWNGAGLQLAQCPAFKAGVYSYHLPTMVLSADQQLSDQRLTDQQLVDQNNHGYPDNLSAIYQALVMGVRDYVQKNGFKKVLLGLSGGIDSALTLAIAVDALGAEAVTAVMMPYRYTSEMSTSDAQLQAQSLGVQYKVLSIESAVEAVMETLSEEFKNTTADIAEQNIQSRSRGLLLMALSNKFNALLLTTGNKSEMAVGYATLYGDMCGGYNVLKDVLKTQVYALANYRNSLCLAGQSLAIPSRVIHRPPSAELAPDQIDEDNLPPYDILDQVIELYVEKDASCADMMALGLERETILKVMKLIDRNEHKRFQSTVGTRVTARGFGRDRRYPLTNGWFAGGK